MFLACLVGVGLGERRAKQSKFPARHRVNSQLLSSLTHARALCPPTTRALACRQLLAPRIAKGGPAASAALCRDILLLADKETAPLTPTQGRSLLFRGSEGEGGKQTQEQVVEAEAQPGPEEEEGFAKMDR